MLSLLELAKCVRRGVRRLDKKIPNWRTVMRQHIGEYDFKNGEHCVLGTLEHYSGRMQVLKRRAGITGRRIKEGYDIGRDAIGAHGKGREEGRGARQGRGVCPDSLRWRLDGELCFLILAEVD